MMDKLKTYCCCGADNPSSISRQFFKGGIGFGFSAILTLLLFFASVAGNPLLAKYSSFGNPITPSATTSTVKVIPNVIPVGGTATIYVHLKDAEGNDVNTGGEMVSFQATYSSYEGSLFKNGSISITGYNGGSITATYSNNTSAVATITPTLGGIPFSNTATVITTIARVKADNTIGTAEGDSWVGGRAPVSTTIGLFDSTLGNSIFGTGSPLSWLGLKVGSGTDLVHIRNTTTDNHVGILAGGVDMLEATRDLEIASFQQQADHTWFVPSDRTFTIGIRLTQTSGAALSLHGAGTINLPGPGTSPDASTNPIFLGDIANFSGSLNANNHSLGLVLTANQRGLISNGNVFNATGIGNLSYISIADGAILDFNTSSPVDVGWDWYSFADDNGIFTLQNSGQQNVTVSPSTKNIGGSGNNQTFVISGSGNGEIQQSLMSGGAAVALQKEGTGTWTLSNTNNGYSGMTTINGGTLEITGRLGNGTLLRGSYAQNIINNARFKINSASSQTLSGVVSGTGELIKDNVGTLTISGTSTYDGNTTVSGGKLLVSGALAGSSGTYAADLVNNAEVEVNSAIDQTYDGALSGSGNWIKDGSGNWTWDGANTSTGDLTVKGGSLRINENSSVPTGDIYVLNGALEFNRSSATTFDSKFYIAGTGSAPTFLNNGTGLVTVAPGNESNIGVDDNEPFTIGGSGDIRLEKSVASGGNGSRLTKVGTGTVTLVSTANNYSGGTTISEGVLQIGDGTNDGTIGSGNITITNGRLAFKRVNPYTVNENFNSFQANTTPGIENNGAGLLTINASNFGFSASGITLELGGTGDGVVDGPIANGGAAANILKDGVGTWTFNDPETNYSGSTTINAGTLEITGRLGKGTYGQSIVNNSELRINTTSAQTLSGVISGTGDLIKDNTGTLTLSGSNTYDGNTTVSVGKLLVSGALAGTSGTYAADLVNNAEVEVNSAIDQTYDGALSGNGDWIKVGTGTWTWNGANTSTGDLTVKGGSLRIN